VAIYRVAADMSGVEFERSFETVSNLRGLCCISRSHHGQVLAFPGPREGSVRLLTRGVGEGSMGGGGGSGSAGLGGIGGEMVHDGLHKRPIAFLALNRDGSILATASQSGELIRLWGTHQVSVEVTVCIYLCMYVYVRAYIHVFAYTLTHTLTHTHTHTYMHACMHTHTHTHTHTHGVHTRREGW
jgi:hypothetical protein